MNRPKGPAERRGGAPLSEGRPGSTKWIRAFCLPGLCSRLVETRTVPIRWRDVDNYGHVNNAVYLTYLEECRDRWARVALGDEFAFVIVRVAIDYRRELSLEDEDVTVTCRGTGYGRSSIRTAERIVAEGRVRGGPVRVRDREARYGPRSARSR